MPYLPLNLKMFKILPYSTQFLEVSVALFGVTTVHENPLPIEVVDRVNCITENAGVSIRNTREVS